MDKLNQTVVDVVISRRDQKKIFKTIVAANLITHVIIGAVASYMRRSENQEVDDSET